MVNSLDLPPQYIENSLDHSYFLLTPLLDHLVCRNCFCVPTQPVELPSRHLHCKPCIVSACKVAGVVCSCDNKPVKVTQLCVPPALTCQLLEGLLVRCPQGCKEVMELKHLTAHLTSKCTHTVVPSPSNISVQQLIEQDHSTPSLMTSQAIGRVFDKVLPASGSFTCKTLTGKVSTKNSAHC